MNAIELAKIRNLIFQLQGSDATCSPRFRNPATLPGIGPQQLPDPVVTAIQALASDVRQGTVIGALADASNVIARELVSRQAPSDGSVDLGRVGSGISRVTANRQAVQRARSINFRGIGTLGANLLINAFFGGGPSIDAGPSLNPAFDASAGPAGPPQQPFPGEPTTFEIPQEPQGPVLEIPSVF